MNSTRMSGETSPSRSASMRPFMPGITTSVSSRCTRSGFSVHTLIASAASSTASTS
jgi:hypothetical protein